MRALVSQRMVRVFECIRMRSQVPRMRILCASARVVPALECQPACSASPRGLGRGREHLLLLPVFRRVALATCSRNRCRHPYTPTAAYSCLRNSGILPTLSPSRFFFLPLQIEESHKSFLQGGADFVGGQFVGWLKPVMHKKRGGALGEGTGRKFPRKNNTCRTRGET